MYVHICLCVRILGFVLVYWELDNAKFPSNSTADHVTNNLPVLAAYVPALCTTMTAVPMSGEQWCLRATSV